MSPGVYEICKWHQIADTFYLPHNSAHSAFKQFKDLLIARNDRWIDWFLKGFHMEPVPSARLKLWPWLMAAIGCGSPFKWRKMSGNLSGNPCKCQVISQASPCESFLLEWPAITILGTSFNLNLLRFIPPSTSTEIPGKVTLSAPKIFFPTG